MHIDHTCKFSSSSLCLAHAATDNHIGYMEKDVERCNDSLEAFEEVLRIAKEQEVSVCCSYMIISLSFVWENLAPPPPPHTHTHTPRFLNPMTKRALMGGGKWVLKKPRPIYKLESAVTILYAYCTISLYCKIQLNVT